MITDLKQKAEVDIPPFHHDTLHCFGDWKKGRFFFDDQESLMKSSTVDLSTVIGHAQCYPTMTWAEMLTKLKRLDRGLKDLSDNPEYFLDGGDKRDWSFVDVDGHHFISAGKHRSAILRYCAYYYPEFFTHGALAHGVRVRKVYQDYETTKICKSITHEISDFPHLEFVYMGKLGHEHRWQLRNRRQHNAWNISRSQLHELHDDLMGSTPIKRILGLGYQACIRENLWAGFNPNDAKLRGC